MMRYLVSKEHFEIETIERQPEVFFYSHGTITNTKDAETDVG